jgi:flagellar motor switch protein FliN/FliY
MMDPKIERLELDEASPVEMPGAALSKPDLALVSHVPVTLSVVVGEAQITMERLFALKAGEVIAMAQDVDQPVTVLLNGRAVATGELVAVGDQFGVRIIDVA